MTDVEYDDDELWGDDDDEINDVEEARCPECGKTVHSLADKCPACGYWLSDADRSAMWSSRAKPLWLRVTAAVVLAAFLLSLLVLGARLF
jgi:ribosomal protein L37E